MTRLPGRRTLKPGGRLAALLVTVGLALTACGGGSARQPVDGITIAEQGVAAGASGLWPRLATDLGFMRQEKVEIRDYVTVSSGAQAINGMLSGAVQISLIGPEGMVARTRGADVVGIAAAFDASVWGLVAGPKITRWSQLRGKTIALGSLSDITRAVMERLVSDAGLDPDRDLRFVQAGATPARVAAVSHGQVDATIATYPELARVAQSTSLHFLGFTADGKPPPPFLATDIQAAGPWARHHPGTVTRYLRAILRTVEYVKNPAHRQDVIRRTAKITKAPPTAVAKMTDFYFHSPATAGLYQPSGLRHSPQAFANTVAAYRDIGVLRRPITENDYMDYSYLKKAVAGLG